MWSPCAVGDRGGGGGGLSDIQRQTERLRNNTNSKLQHCLNLPVFLVTSETEQHPSPPWRWVTAGISLNITQLSAFRHSGKNIWFSAAVHAASSASHHHSQSLAPWFKIIRLNVTLTPTCGSFILGWDVALTCTSTSIISLLLIQHTSWDGLSLSPSHLCAPLWSPSAVCVINYTHTHTHTHTH